MGTMTKWEEEWEEKWTVNARKSFKPDETVNEERPYIAAASQQPSKGLLSYHASGMVKIQQERLETYILAQPHPNPPGPQKLHVWLWIQSYPEAQARQICTRSMKRRKGSRHIDHPPPQRRTCWQPGSGTATITVPAG